MKKTAVISECGRYRYNLVREWDETLPRVLWVMLNPSKADGLSDDPTIRKCIGFAKRWGFGSIEVVNLFAWRATDPKELGKCLLNVRGPEFERYWTDAKERAKLVIFGWGAGISHSRQSYVTATAADVFQCAECLGRTKDGEPRHPLMLAYDTQREAYIRDGEQP